MTSPSLVADVSGNGTVPMLDAAMIAGVRGGSQARDGVCSTTKTDATTASRKFPKS